MAQLFQTRPVIYALKKRSNTLPIVPYAHSRPTLNPR